jgi:S-adenosylmethionine uptake transporter
MDGVMKGLVLAIGAYNAMLWRQGAGFLIGGTTFILSRSRWPSPAAMRLHVIRGIVGGALAFAFFWGIGRVPLAEGIALSFIAPIITLFLASIILKERISRHSIIASLLGLAGVGVILSGSLGGQHDGEALLGIASILLSAVLYAYNLILQRQQAQIAAPVEVAFFVNIFAFAAMAVFAPWLAEIPSSEETLPIFFAAALAFVSMLLLSWSYGRAEAQLLVPVEYPAFIWAAIIGWVFFGEPLTPETLIGTGLIVAGCLISARQQPVHIETTAV